MGSWLDQRISEIRIINEVVKQSDMDMEVIKPYLTSINEIVRDSYGNPEETYAVGTVDGLGWINDELTIDVSQRDYFKEAMTTREEYVIGAPVISKSDNEPIFLICYPIRGEDGNAIGFINGSINLDRLEQVTEDLNVLDGTAWIMNINGDIYTQPELITEQYADNLSAIIDSSKDGNGSIEVISNGERVTIFYSQVPYAKDWLLCDAIPTKTLTSTSTTIITTLLMSALLSGLLICLASYFLSRNMVQENQRLIEEVSVIDERERKAEIRALQAQISPHFLYNSLDTIQWKALEYGAYDIAEMIQKLAQIFRISLSNGKEYIPVSDEIKHVQSYLDIQKIRYKEKISYTMNIDDTVLHCYMPKLIIQPLVENSIYHGIKESDHDGIITITIEHSDQNIHIIVADNGKGMPNKELQELKRTLHKQIETDHYGLFNIYEKLVLTYGPQCKFDLYNNNGFTVEITFPDKIPGETI